MCLTSSCNKIAEGFVLDLLCHLPADPAQVVDDLDGVEFPDIFGLNVRPGPARSNQRGSDLHYRGPKESCARDPG